MSTVANFPFVIIRQSETFDSEPHRPYLLIAKSEIDTIAVSDTYDQNGQQVSAYEADDSLTLHSQKAVKAANYAWNNFFQGEEGHHYTEHFSGGYNISAYDHPEEYDAVIEHCEEDTDYILFQETLEGFNYWNGHNWKTVSVQVENGEPSHELIEDEELTELITNEYKARKLESDQLGYQTYYTPSGWEFVKSQCAGDFEAWKVYSPEMIAK